LVPALAGLEWAIRHEPNRTSILEKAEFLLNLVGQITEFLSSPSRKNISLNPSGKSLI
jgi:hypothetical protein